MGPAATLAATIVPRMRPRLSAVRTGVRGIRTLRNWPDVLSAVIRGKQCTELRLRDGTIVSAEADYQLWNHFNDLWLMECYLPFGQIESNSTVVDIGANVGIFSLWAARAARRIVACEPSERSFSQLVTNVGASGRADTVECLRLAVGGVDGEAVLVQDDAPTGARLLERGHPSPGGSSERVEAVTLSTLFTMASISACELLKLDCEGSEFPILLGTDDDVVRSTRRIVAEVHEFLGAGRLADLVERLEGAGYSTRARANGPGCWLLDAVRT